MPSTISDADRMELEAYGLRVCHDLLGPFGFTVESLPRLAIEERRLVVFRFTKTAKIKGFELTHYIVAGNDLDEFSGKLASDIATMYQWCLRQCESQIMKFYNRMRLYQGYKWGIPLTHSAEQPQATGASLGG